ncbi:MAG TPA: LytTR family DNA-binding domain-containing protein [Longimicrobiales bacterium]|nr:LytTR family DNA-binding domain-containing protein [Longimicrobiales bacterium]
MRSEAAAAHVRTQEDARAPLRRLLVRRDGALRLIALQDVTWIEADGNYVRIHTNGHTFRIRTTLSALEQRLDPDQFARVHRSALVNLDRIAEISPWSYGDYLIRLEDGTRIKLSRYYRRNLEARFGIDAALEAG